MIQKMFGRRWWWTTLLVLLGSAVCVRLGIWQLDRLDQRRTFNAHYLSVRAMPPLLLAGEQPDLINMEYRDVIVTGYYDAENQVVLRNRYHDNVYGFDLLTPLILADGSAILIDRGWIPAEGNANPLDWGKYTQSGTVRVKGILRLGQSKPDMGGVPDPELAPGQTRLDFWNIVNLERISQQLPYPLLPVFVEPDPDPSQSNPPFPSQPEVDISEGPHMGYALQWFTFAAILFFGYPFFLQKQQS